MERVTDEGPPPEEAARINAEARYYNELDIQATKVSKDGKFNVTLSLSDKVIECQTLNITNGKARDQFIDQICTDHPGIDRAVLLSKLKSEAAAKMKPQATVVSSRDPQAALAKMPATVRKAAKDMLHGDNLMERIVKDIAALGVAGEKKLSATTYLAGTSRLLNRPISLIVRGPSSSGKSYVLEKVGALFPPESVLLATQQTPQALFYMQPGELKHRFVVGGERSRVMDDDAAEASRALREMISAGKLSKLIPVKENGAMTTKLIEQDGPISYCETTTGEVFEEDANRCLMLYTDERESQTRKIVTSLAKTYAGGSCDTSGIIERHHAAQRMLRPCEIVVPYAERLGELITSGRVELRRAFPQLISTIKASALLHQFQRSYDSQMRLIASEADYALAYKLLAGPMSRMLGGAIPEPARRFLERITAKFPVDEPFTSQDARAGESFEKRTVSRWLADLNDVGILDQVEPPKGRKPATWKLIENSALDTGDCPDLPTPELLFSDSSVPLSH